MPTQAERYFYVEINCDGLDRGHIRFENKTDAMAFARAWYNANVSDNVYVYEVASTLLFNSEA